MCIVNGGSVIRPKPSSLPWDRSRSVSMHWPNSQSLQSTLASHAICILDGQGGDRARVDPLSDKGIGEYPLACLGLNITLGGVGSLCLRLHGGVHHLRSLHPTPSAAGVWRGNRWFAFDGKITGDVANTIDYWIAWVVAASACTYCDSCSRWSGWFLC